MTRKQNQKVFGSKLKKTPPHPYLCMLLLLIAAVVVIVADAAVAVVIVVISLLFGLFTDKMTPFTNS